MGPALAVAAASKQCGWATMWHVPKSLPQPGRHYLQLHPLQHLALHACGRTHIAYGVDPVTLWQMACWPNATP